MKFIRFNLGDDGENVGTIDIIRKEIVSVSSRADERGCHLHLKNGGEIEIFDDHKYVIALLEGEFESMI